MSKATYYQFDQACFWPSDGRLQGPDGESVHLRPKVASLLTCLLTQPNEVVSKTELIEAIWPDGAVIEFEAGLAALLSELRHQFSLVGVSPETIETLPRRGVRLNASVEKVADSPMNTSSSSNLASQPRLRTSITPVLRPIIATAILFIIVAFIVLKIAPPLETPPSEENVDVPNSQTLVILPFEVFGEDTSAEGMDQSRRAGLLMADALLSQLWSAELEGLSLLGRASLNAYGDSADWMDSLARDLAVDLIIEGRIVMQGEDVQINARLLRSDTMQILWSETIRWNRDTPMPQGEWSQAELASEALVQALQLQWGSLMR